MSYPSYLFPLLSFFLSSPTSPFVPQAHGRVAALAGRERAAPARPQHPEEGREVEQGHPSS